MLSTIEKTRILPSATTPAHSLEAQIGNTPLIRLWNTAVTHNIPDTVAIYAKAEWFNPSGSVKDRAAFNIIRTAEENRQLQPGMTLLDSTSGNMGIAYAMLGAARGYKIKLTLPGNASPERIAILIQEAKQSGLEILPPDINKSFTNFTPEGPAIRFGLLAIKNVGGEITKKTIFTLQSLIDQLNELHEDMRSVYP